MDTKPEVSFFYNLQRYLDLNFCSSFQRLVNFCSLFRFPFVYQNFLVDIKGPALAFLPVLAFEGGTRRNIPKFEV